MVHESLSSSKLGMILEYGSSFIRIYMTQQIDHHCQRGLVGYSVGFVKPTATKYMIQRLTFGIQVSYATLSYPKVESSILSVGRSSAPFLHVDRTLFDHPDRSSAECVR